MKHFLFLLFLLLNFVIIAAFSPAMAEVISRPDIERHLKAMVDLYNKEKIDYDLIYKFSKDYMVDEGLYRTDLYVEGQEEPIIKSQDKEQTLRDLRSNKLDYVKAFARYKVNDFKLNNDNTVATVNYTVWHDATTKIQSPIDSKEMLISFTSVTSCNEKFALRGTQVVGLENVCEVRMKSDKPISAELNGAK